MTSLFRIGLFDICPHSVQIGDSLVGSYSRLQMSQDLKDPIIVPARVQFKRFGHLLLVDDRHKEIGRDKQQSPLEPRWRYTNDSERMLVQPNNAAHHAAIVLKV